MLALTLVIVAPVAVYKAFPNPWGIIPLAFILVLVWTQLGFYRYLAQKRSVAFAIAVIPMQFLFYTGCALAIPLGVADYLLDGRTS